MEDKKKIFMAVGAVCLLLIAVLGYYIYTTQQQLSNLTQQYEIEKEELADEYTQLAIQYEGYKLNVNNDSLADKLETERLKVQRLVEELKTTKATNARRISELRKELTTVRGVLRTYIAQVDSLNQINRQLKEENREVVRKYQAVTASASVLKKEKEQLTEKVTLASKLDAVAIQAQALTRRNKDTERISRAEKIQVDFTLAKNITATVGDKDVFVRILKPDNDALVKNNNTLFSYEDQEISYSMKKRIEYTGEETAVSLVWVIEEFLNPGTYRVDIFADGALIGQKSFDLR